MGTLTRRAGLAVLLAAAMDGGAQAASRPQEQSYGPGSARRIDVYPQTGLSGAPVLLFVHGGAWALGDKRAVNALPDYAQRQGFLLMSAGYRLAPQVDAGGEAEDIAGVIALDGAGYNAAQEMAWFARRPMVELDFRNAFGSRADALSPTLLAKPGMSFPPFLILYITTRPDSPPQARALAAAIQRAGGMVSVRATTDRTHAEINQSFGRPGDPEGEMGAAFIKTGLLPASTS